MGKNKPLTLIQPIEDKILLIREQRVILDFHLAEIYEVTTGRLIEQVKRNIERFPPDFLFQLSTEECELLRSQIAISKNQGRGGRRYRPYAFTEHGAVMAANVLRSKRAIQASIYVVRAFIKLKQFIASHKELALKINELERNVATHDKAICSLFDAIRKLMSYPDKPRRKIGFKLNTEKND